MTRPAPADGEAGSVTLFLAITVVGLLVLAGLIVDGGAKVRAAQRADRVAAEAARAAGQALDVVAVLDAGSVRVDRRAAVVAAQQYLADAGVDGAVTVTAGGAGLQVRTHAQAPTVFLGLVGVTEFSVTGSAEVVLVHDARGGVQ